MNTAANPAPRLAVRDPATALDRSANTRPSQAGSLSQKADSLSRREYMRWGAQTALAATLLGGARDSIDCAAGHGAEPAPAAKSRTRKKVAGIVTTYFRNSHADVILTKILEGWRHDGGPGPALELVAVYIDQLERSDFGLELCKKHGVPVFSTIAQAPKSRSCKIQQ